MNEQKSKDKSGPDYYDYFTTIEKLFQAKRQAFTLLSSVDWLLMENWYEGGVSLECALKGIELAFSRTATVHSLAFCTEAVMEVFRQRESLNVGGKQRSGITLKTETPEERVTKAENALAALAERQALQDEEIETNAGAIRDLITVSRTLIEAQMRTDERLNSLINTIERLIQGFPPIGPA